VPPASSASFCIQSVPKIRCYFVTLGLHIVVALTCYNPKDYNSLKDLRACVCPCYLMGNSHERFVFAVFCYGMPCFLCRFYFQINVCSLQCKLNHVAWTYEFAMQAFCPSLCTNQHQIQFVAFIYWRQKQSDRVQVGQIDILRRGHLSRIRQNCFLSTRSLKRLVTGFRSL
jgi:hypothetical protein